jgi:hypothetical protein
MRIRVWAVGLLFALTTGAAVAQTPPQSQPQPMPMGGMDMGQGKTMDMSACQCNCMSQGKAMDMGKQMDMGQANPMEMGSGKGMDMGKGMSMGHGTGKPPVPAGPLKITFGAKSAEWTVAALAALPHKTVTAYDEHAKACRTYSGVPVIDLLTPLGVPGKQHGKDLRLYLVAVGSDGYEAVYSVAEVNPDVHDGTVIIADAIDGKPIADTGPLEIVAAGDKRSARWVYYLTAIRVLAAD